MIAHEQHLLGRIKFWSLSSSFHSRYTSTSSFHTFHHHRPNLVPHNISSAVVSPLSRKINTTLTTWTNTKVDEDGGGRHQRSHQSNSESSWTTAKLCGITGAVIFGIFISQQLKHSPLLAAAVPDKKKFSGNLPVYSKSQVAEHYEPEKRIWVTFQNGVYDVTDFVSQHPGGNRILMAAGSSLEPFWELYPVHKQPNVLKILEKYRIGNLDARDVQVVKSDTSDAFSQEPQRHAALIQQSKKPFNAETPPNLLSATFYTPNELFYVRNHLPVPQIDMANYELEVEGINLKGKSFTLADIKKLPKVKISATIQCGGNRRSEMNEAKSVHGLAWSGGAIGTATWSGARLIDVLKSAGFRLDQYKSPNKIHVQFEGLDNDPSGESYGASIPLSYLLDENFEGIVAYEMNGETIPLDHGFPLRIILPGIVGARNVKWLGKIIVSDEESHSPWQRRDYKVFSPSVTLETVDYSSSPAIMDTPVTSYICSHENGEKVPKGNNTLTGYAFSGGGRNIVRVELSMDKGKSWQLASLQHDPLREASTRNWAWSLWEAKLNFPQKGEYEVWVKAVDSGYNQQAETFQNIWNYRGFLSNAYHKVKVTAN